MTIELLSKKLKFNIKIPKVYGTVFWSCSQIMYLHTWFLLFEIILHYILIFNRVYFLVNKEPNEYRILNGFK